MFEKKKENRERPCLRKKHSSVTISMPYNYSISTSRSISSVNEVKRPHSRFLLFHSSADPQHTIKYSKLMHNPSVLESRHWFSCGVVSFLSPEREIYVGKGWWIIRKCCLFRTFHQHNTHAPTSSTSLEHSFSLTMRSEFWAGKYSVHFAFRISITRLIIDF